MRGPKRGIVLNSLLFIIYGLGLRSVSSALSAQVLKVMEGKGGGDEVFYDTWADSTLNAFIDGRGGVLEL